MWDFAGSSHIENVPLLAIVRINFNQVVSLPTHTNVVLYQQTYELLPTHQGNGCGIGPFSFNPRALAEIACGDDQTLLMCAQAATTVFRAQSHSVTKKRA